MGDDQGESHQGLHKNFLQILSVVSIKVVSISLYAPFDAQAGTLERLVEALTTQSGEINAKHYSEFFATYRAIATTKEVLQITLARYKDVYDSGDDTDEDDRAARLRRNILE